MGDERSDLRLQISEERRELDAADAKRDERMSVLEAKFEELRESNKLLFKGFLTMTFATAASAAAIVFFGGGVG